MCNFRKKEKLRNGIQRAKKSINESLLKEFDDIGDAWKLNLIFTAVVSQIQRDLKVATVDELPVSVKQLIALQMRTLTPPETLLKRVAELGKLSSTLPRISGLPQGEA